MTRRQLSAALVGLTAKAERRIAGGFADGSPHLAGHRLRDGDRTASAAARPARRMKSPVVIVGGGIAGLSAGWWLARRGFRDFVILEMEAQAGGNSRWGEGEAGPYPWAAHYVPAPGAPARLVRELFEELGVMSASGEFEETYLCHTPQERLFLHGRWQEGIEPEVGATRRDHDEYRRFAARMAEFAASGEFRIPRDLGACRRRDLDSLTMAEWMTREGFAASEYLRWYADYACRDDYGGRADAVSAWAGIHYFAARRQAEQGEAGKEQSQLLTWPEGNGWIVRRLLQRVGAEERVRTGEFVTRIERQGRSGWQVTASSAVYEAAVVIFAAPTYLVPYLTDAALPGRRVYSPWLTANLTLDRWPRERGVPMAWDNVLYRSPALGYVVSTHQLLRQYVDRTVWTYYWALADGRPADVRKQLLERDWSYWKEAVLSDLERAHPDIRECVSRVDIMRFGHAMARPVPGFLGGAPLAAAGLGAGDGFLLANSDLSGFSIFEEAQYRGVEAARAALVRLGGGGR